MGLPDPVQVYFSKPIKRKTVEGNNAAFIYCTEMTLAKILGLRRDFLGNLGLRAPECPLHGCRVRLHNRLHWCVERLEVLFS